MYIYYIYIKYKYKYICIYIYIYPRYDSLLPGDCKFLREFCVNVYYKKQASWIDRG